MESVASYFIVCDRDMPKISRYEYVFLGEIYVDKLWRLFSVMFPEENVVPLEEKFLFKNYSDVKAFYLKPLEVKQFFNRMERIDKEYFERKYPLAAEDNELFNYVYGVFQKTINFFELAAFYDNGILLDITAPYKGGGLKSGIPDLSEVIAVLKNSSNG